MKARFTTTIDGCSFTIKVFRKTEIKVERRSSHEFIVSSGDMIETYQSDDDAKRHVVDMFCEDAPIDDLADTVRVSCIVAALLYALR